MGGQRKHGNEMSFKNTMEGYPWKIEQRNREIRER